MGQSSIPSSAVMDYDRWLVAQIFKLSVDALNVGVLTCTACAESTAGEYVIEYQGETLRYSPEQAYAFLSFVLEGLNSPSV